MSTTNYFEGLAPGMRAKLDPRYRILKNRENADYAELLRELLQSDSKNNSPFTTDKKESGSPGRMA
ncbi:hypothetical protein ACFLXF_02510 [Chloroflexota bacterium]